MVRCSDSSPKLSFQEDLAEGEFVGESEGYALWIWLFSFCCLVGGSLVNSVLCRWTKSHWVAVS